MTPAVWLRAGACALCVLIGWVAQGWRLNAQHSAALLEIATSVAATAQLTNEKQLELNSQIGELQDEHRKREEQLRADAAAIDVGTRVVYVEADCPAVPAPGPSTASANPAGTARLSAKAARDFAAYELAYNDQLKQLRECVAYARKVEEKLKARN